MAPDAGADLSPVFAALGDPTRLELVSRLGSGKPRSIAQLAQGLQQSRQGITKHLKVLEQAGLVRAQRQGREKRFVGKSAQIHQARTYLDTVSRQWDAALTRLKGIAEETDAASSG